jgi:hypothetical protein
VRPLDPAETNSSSHNILELSENPIIAVQACLAQKLGLSYLSIWISLVIKIPMQNITLVYSASHAHPSSICWHVGHELIVTFLVHHSKFLAIKRKVRWSEEKAHTDLRQSVWKRDLWDWLDLVPWKRFRGLYMRIGTNWWRIGLGSLFNVRVGGWASVFPSSLPPMLHMCVALIVRESGVYITMIEVRNVTGHR